MKGVEEGKPLKGYKGRMSYTGISSKRIEIMSKAPEEEVG